MDEELANDLLDDMDFDRYGKVKCGKDRRDGAEGDEDGGGRDGEFFSAGKPLSTARVATYETISPAENDKEGNLNNAGIK